MVPLGFRHIKLELARRKYLRFIKYCWHKAEPFTEGLHTRIICDRIDKALEDFRNGKSTFLRIKVHQRAGKSDLVSRFLPPRFIGEFPDCEVMDVSYSGSKAESFSRFGLRLLDSHEYKEIFPKIIPNRRAAGKWNVQVLDEENEEYLEGAGQVLASGLSSGLTGDGYHLGILDDYCGSRADAESAGFREKTWDAFTNDFLTRKAPVSITIILATQWHVDDIHGRIERKNNPTSTDYDPEFPVFEEISFPAKREEAPEELAKQYPGDWLFLERYPEEWYRQQYAQLGHYASSAMMGCDPVPRGGGILDTSKIQTHKSHSEFPQDLVFYRVWDYAHKAVQRVGHDPDYTGGTLLAYRNEGVSHITHTNVYSLWIADYVQFREGAVERDKKIRETARKDTPRVKIVVETSLDSIDGFTYLEEQLAGVYTVVSVHPKGDKVQRCTPIEPIFSIGNVHILEGAWNSVWLDGLKRFDGSGKTHDEMVDNLTAGYEYIAGGTWSLYDE